MWQAVRVKHSRWPAVLLLCGSSCQLIVCWYWPDTLPASADIGALLLALLMAYQLFLLLAQPVGTLWLHSDGQARWQGDTVHWLPASTWCWAGFWLHWQDSRGQARQRWVFIDALSDADKRTLARQLSQALQPPPLRQRPTVL